MVYNYLLNNFIINSNSVIKKRTSQSSYNITFFSINRVFKLYFNLLIKSIFINSKFIILSNVNTLFFKLSSAYNLFISESSYKWLSIFITFNLYFKYNNNYYFKILLNYIKNNKINGLILVSSKLNYSTHELFELSGLMCWSVTKNRNYTIKYNNPSITFVHNLNFLKFFTVYLLNILLYSKKLYILTLIKKYIYFKKCNILY